MSRLLSYPVLAFGAALGLIAWAAMGCDENDLDTSSTSTDSGTVRRDSAPVDPTEAGPPLDGGGGPAPSCEKYCDLVTTNCVGDHAQYGSKGECLAFCNHLPLEQPGREGAEKNAPSVACRQYWADAPARTSPESYCLAAGPFGGNACGDRCTAFCSVLLSACSPDGGVAAYQSQPDCATACTGFAYRDAGTDGGGESPDGPTSGDSLNCRLYWLREATMDPYKCSLLAPQSNTCTE